MSSHFGITGTGFERKRLNQLLNEIESKMKSIFGENFNVSPDSPDGQVNGVVSESNANLWEILEAAYNGFNPSAATGVALSNLVMLNNITRDEEKPTRVLLDVTGVSGTIIPAGRLVSSIDGNIKLSTEDSLTINLSGVGSVFASATVMGPVPALAGTITQIDSQITGWDTVTNPNDGVLGSYEETDVELRVRRNKSIALPSQSMVDSIFSEVSNVDGISSVAVLENETDFIDVNGLPAHSFQAIVVGGLDQDIADAIFLKKPLGIESFGTTTVSVNDLQTFPHNISFSRPISVPIFVIVNTVDLGNLPVDADELIKQAIVDYANGILTLGRSFAPGENVIFSELYTPVNSVDGHSVTSMFIDTSSSPATTADIPINILSASLFDVSNIVVNIS